jgi:hypothetical protein
MLKIVHVQSVTPYQNKGLCKYEVQQLMKINV